MYVGLHTRTLCFVRFPVAFLCPTSGSEQSGLLFQCNGRKLFLLAAQESKRIYKGFTIFSKLMDEFGHTFLAISL